MAAARLAAGAAVTTLVAMSTRRWLLVVLGFAVSAAALVLAFWRVTPGPHLEARVRPEALRAALAGARPAWLGGFFALNLGTLGWRALQLRALARRRDGGPPAFVAALDAVAIGLMAQNLLPARLGEAARPYVLARAGDVGLGHAAGAAVLGRALDLVALVAVAAAAALAGGMPAWLTRAAWLGAAVAAALLVALALVARGRATRAALQRRWPRLGGAMDGFATGLTALASPARLAQAGVASVAAPLTQALAYAAALRAFGLEALPAASALVLTVAVLVAIALPAAPSSLGVFHAAATWTLMGLGAAAAPAAAFALVVHALGVVGFVAAGAVSAARLGRRTRLSGPPPRA